MVRHDRFTLLHSTLGAAVVGVFLTSTGGAYGDSPAHVEMIEGTGLNRIVLTQSAAERLGIQTGQISQAGVMKTAPYAAVFYDSDGKTWVYTNPELLTYVRHAIVIESVDGNEMLLKEGPDIGVNVVTIGVAELFGTESGVGH